MQHIRIATRIRLLPKILTTKLICVYTVLQQPWAIAMIPKQKVLKAKRARALALLTTEGT